MPHLIHLNNPSVKNNRHLRPTIPRLRVSQRHQKMKTIIAEKPSVAKEIAHIVGATKREEGYMHGNGYYVTWAFGHLVQPAMPEAYGMKGFHAENLPVIPRPFILVPRQVKTEGGYKPDAGVVAQIKVIGKLFDSSERIIVATDAGREGELIFRYLYEYLGCKKPFDRLWISSLTDSAIREGLANLKSGKDYDNLYHAAKARSEADWLVGINGTQALTIAAGRGTYSVGRVQTPTLGMVCERYWENRRFESKPFWQVHFGVVDAESGNILKFTSANRWTDKAMATDIYNKMKETGTAVITKVATKRKVEKAPLLYDLTTLQKEANTQYSFTAEHTLAIAQKLYEAKLITYPRTSSRYISDDVFATVPKLFKNLENHSEYGEMVALLPYSDEYSKNSVNGGKVTDHHALLITESPAIGLYKDEKTIYEMVLNRMIEAFSTDCIKDINITAVMAQAADDVEFCISGSIIRQAGWRALSLKKKNGKQNSDSDQADNEVKDQVLPNWQEGQHIKVMGCTITEGKTKPKPLHTESTLLAAMETAGKDIEDEAMRQAMKDSGIGTPATRAAIIETLLRREYMVRQQKKLMPTEKGLALHSVVKNMAIANVEMTGRWEAELAKIERGEANAEVFTNEIESYTHEITAELLGCDKLFSHKDSGCQCPKCKQGTMQFFGKVVRCSNKECGMPVFKQVAGKLLSDADITDLFTKGRTKTLNGFTSKQGKTFSAAITFDEDFNTKFVFAEKKCAEKRGNMKRYKK